jgi:hypothetical protein
MNIISNEKKIARYAKIGMWTSMIGLVFLIGAVIISFQSAENLGLSFLLMAFGFLLSQIGIYYGNRWGRSPRPDELLNKTLKGLDRNFSIIHYQSPVSHLLLGPTGLWILNPRRTRGTITFQEAKGRWRQKGGSLYLKVFAQESLGRPDLEIAGEIQSLTRFFKKNFDADKIPEINAALVFTNEDVSVEAENAPIPTLHLRKLKNFIRNYPKKPGLSKTQLKEILALFTD